MLSAIEMRMENMRHINIVMKECHRTFASEEHIRIFIQKTAHQIFWENIVVQ